MPYFIPRPRHIKHRGGPPTPASWPASTTIWAQLSPLDLFGPSASAHRRAVIRQSAADVRIAWNANNGEYVVESATFLAPLRLALTLSNGITIEINQAKLSARFEASSFHDVLGVVEIIEHHYSAYLSLLTGVYVSIEAMSGQVDQTEVTFELKRIPMRSQVTIEKHRGEHVVQALMLASPDSARWARMLFAALYYQQAVRLLSPLDVRVPSLNLAEVVVNLAKALEVLFGSERDSMREGLRSIGLADTLIESQVIPLVLARNQLDGAHPVGTHVEEDLLTVLHHYVERAMTNMRAVLILATKAMQEGKASIRELESNDVQERVKLLSLMKEYLAQPPIQAD